MELDELKMAWGQFNDKINGQELVGRQQLKQMLAKKKMSNYSRLLWYERISLGFLFFVFLGLFACFLIVGPFYWMSVATMLSIVVLVASGVNLFQYCKLKQAGCMKNDLESDSLYPAVQIVALLGIYQYLYRCYSRHCLVYYLCCCFVELHYCWHCSITNHSRCVYIPPFVSESRSTFGS